MRARADLDAGKDDCAGADHRPLADDHLAGAILVGQKLVTENRRVVAEDYVVLKRRQFGPEHVDRRLQPQCDAVADGDAEAAQE